MVIEIDNGDDVEFIDPMLMPQHRPSLGEVPRPDGGVVIIYERGKALIQVLRDWNVPPNFGGMESSDVIVTVNSADGGRSSTTSVSFDPGVIDNARLLFDEWSKGLDAGYSLKFQAAVNRALEIDRDPSLPKPQAEPAAEPCPAQEATAPAEPAKTKKALKPAKPAKPAKKAKPAPPKKKPKN